MNTPEEYMQTATKLAESILSSLGFECSIAASWDGNEVSLMLQSPDSGIIIGDNGSRLDDLQYLLNRLVTLREPNMPRIRVDCDHYRERSETKIVQSAIQKAERVLATGKPITVGPMNAYHRRLVHSALADMEGVKTESEEVDSRFKRITISRVDA